MDFMELGMMLRTIGFILACFPSAFFAVVFMGDTHQDNVPIVFIPVIIALFPLLAAHTRIARFAAWLSGPVLLAFSIIAGFSIGLFYIPSSLAIIAAGLVPRAQTEDSYDTN
jgi:hypothetical protein